MSRADEIPWLSINWEKVTRIEITSLRKGHRTTRLVNACHTWFVLFYFLLRLILRVCVLLVYQLVGCPWVAFRDVV